MIKGQCETCARYIGCPAADLIKMYRMNVNIDACGNYRPIIVCYDEYSVRKREDGGVGYLCISTLFRADGGEMDE